MQASEPVLSIDAYVAAELPASGAPGLAYAVVENGEVASNAHGEILKGRGSPVLTDTPFLIGSISKSFTAMAIMTLVEAGETDLDGEVSRYLDIFRDRPSGAITIRQLLSHTSGYSTRQGNDTHIDRTDTGDELRRQVERIAQWSPAHAPDARWQYSNANYLILGVVIEEVSGQDFASYVESEILEPIGMEHSFVADGESHDGMAVGHQPWFGSKRPLKDNRTNRVTAPAGGVVSSANDLGLYLATMLNGKDDIISAESKSAMLRPASAASPFYGLGWYFNAVTGESRHGGLSPGIETLAILSPKEGKGTVVLINANSGMGFGVNTALFNGVSAKALGRDYSNSDTSSWGPKSVFLTFLALPVFFSISAVWVGLRRNGLYSKSGPFGVFSLWFPLVVTLALAWTAVQLIPRLFGVPLSTLSLYQPDFAIALVATAATGVIWAVFRLALFYGGKPKSE